MSRWKQVQEKATEVVNTEQKIKAVPTTCLQNEVGARWWVEREPRVRWSLAQAYHRLVTCILIFS